MLIKLELKLVLALRADIPYKGPRLLLKFSVEGQEARSDFLSDGLRGVVDSWQHEVLANLLKPGFNHCLRVS